MEHMTQVCNDFKSLHPLTQLLNVLTTDTCQIKLGMFLFEMIYSFYMCTLKLCFMYIKCLISRCRLNIILICIYPVFTEILTELKLSLTITQFCGCVTFSWQNKRTWCLIHIAHILLHIQSKY